MSAGLAASTVTPGITEPCASLTTPLIDAPSWACATNGPTMMRSESKNHRPAIPSALDALPTVASRRVCGSRLSTLAPVGIVGPLLGDRCEHVLVALLFQRHVPSAVEHERHLV